MSWRHVLFCLAAIVLAAAPADAQSGRVKSDQEILTELEMAWDNAFHRKDIAFLQTILADEFMVTYEDGSRGDKKQELALTAGFNQQVDSSMLDDFTVKVFGNTAVVWFTQHMVGPVQGRPVELTLRYTDVWVLRDARWWCVASQSTKVTGPPR